MKILDNSKLSFWFIFFNYENSKKIERIQNLAFGILNNYENFKEFQILAFEILNNYGNFNSQHLTIKITIKLNYYNHDFACFGLGL
jgi:hypothetical protein